MIGVLQASLVLTMGADRLGCFFPFLQQGFGVPARVPCTVKELLCDQFGMDVGYVTERITTIFLNGKATDDIEKAVAGNGSLIALSAAMPGLVGATMRRGGYYAAMRSAITLGEQETTGSSGDGTVRVKLFNLLLTELGPEFLRQGVLLAGTEGAAFFRELEQDFWSGCAKLTLDGTPIAPEALKNNEALAGKAAIRLSVEFRKDYENLTPPPTGEWSIT